MKLADYLVSCSLTAIEDKPWNTSGRLDKQRCAVTGRGPQMNHLHLHQARPN